MKTRLSPEDRAKNRLMRGADPLQRTRKATTARNQINYTGGDPDAVRAMADQAARASTKPKETVLGDKIYSGRNQLGTCLAELKKGST